MKQVKTKPVLGHQLKDGDHFCFNGSGEGTKEVWRFDKVRNKLMSLKTGKSSMIDGRVILQGLPVNKVVDKEAISLLTL